MNKIICLCFISLQLVSGISETSIVKQPENIISSILNTFKNNFAQLNQIIENEENVFDEKNDALCLQQVNAIMSGLNNSDLWAIKREY